jgi:hypothetical protein
MSEQTFDHRIAVLEEHLVPPPQRTAEDRLDEAEECLAYAREDNEDPVFWESMARWALTQARIARDREECEWDEEDDDA